jgi:hypothetical protein
VAFRLSDPHRTQFLALAQARKSDRAGIRIVVHGLAGTGIAVVDARTGIVEMQYSERVAADLAGEKLLSDQARKALEEFLALQSEH